MSAMRRHAAYTKPFCDTNFGEREEFEKILEITKYSKVH